MRLSSLIASLAALVACVPELDPAPESRCFNSEECPPLELCDVDTGVCSLGVPQTFEVPQGLRPEHVAITSNNDLWVYGDVGAGSTIFRSFLGRDFEPTFNEEDAPRALDAERLLLAWTSRGDLHVSEDGVTRTVVDNDPARVLDQVVIAGGVVFGADSAGSVVAARRGEPLAVTSIGEPVVIAASEVLFLVTPTRLLTLPFDFADGQSPDVLAVGLDLAASRAVALDERLIVFPSAASEAPSDILLFERGFSRVLASVAPADGPALEVFGTALDRDFVYWSADDEDDPDAEGLVQCASLETGEVTLLARSPSPRGLLREDISLWITDLDTGLLRVDVNAEPLPPSGE